MEHRIHVPRESYRGANPARRRKQIADAELCRLVEIELQRRYDAIPPGQMEAVLAYQVAAAIGRDVESVRRIMCRINGGSNGVTYGKMSSDRSILADPAPETIVRSTSAPSTSDGAISLTDRVVHDRFGMGVVTHIDGDKLEVDFEELGLKRVLCSFVTRHDDDG